MFVVAGIVLVISIGSRFSGYLNEAANGILSKDILFLLITYRIPKFLELIIPISFFLSVMLVYGRLHVDSEMVVLETSGMGPYRIMVITLLMSLVVMTMTAGVTLWLKPVGETQVGKLFAGQRSMTEFDTLAPGRFQSLPSGKRVTYAESFTENGDLSKVFINEYKVSNFFGPQDVITVVSERGETQIDENNNRFLVLNDGYRYSGKPGEKDYQVIEYEEYGQLIEKVVPKERDPEQTAKPTGVLLASPDLKDRAELQWRFSIILMIPLIALMAVPLSRVNPRQGRFSRLLPGMLLCFFYIIALSSARSSIGRGNLPVYPGMLWIHGLFIVVTVLLYQINNLKTRLSRLVNRANPGIRS